MFVLVAESFGFTSYQPGLVLSTAATKLFMLVPGKITQDFLSRPDGCACLRFHFCDVTLVPVVIFDGETESASVLEDLVNDGDASSFATGTRQDHKCCSPTCCYIPPFTLRSPLLSSCGTCLNNTEISLLFN